MCGWLVWRELSGRWAKNSLGKEGQELRGKTWPGRQRRACDHYDHSGPARPNNYLLNALYTIPANNAPAIGAAMNNQS